MGQKAGKKWTAAAVLQPTFLLPPTLLTQKIYADYAYSGAFNKDLLQFRGCETADLTSGNTRISIDLRGTAPFVSSVDSLDVVVGKQSMVCPRV